MSVTKKPKAPKPPKKVPVKPTVVVEPPQLDPGWYWVTQNDNAAIVALVSVTGTASTRIEVWYFPDPTLGVPTYHWPNPNDTAGVKQVTTAISSTVFNQKLVTFGATPGKWSFKGTKIA